MKTRRFFAFLLVLCFAFSFARAEEGDGKTPGTVGQWLDQAEGSADIPAVTVAQYLTGVFEKTGISTEEQAQQLADGLDTVLEN